MDLFGLIFDFISVVALKALSLLPTIQNDPSQYLSVLTDNLGIVNWFIPFYELYDMFMAWLAIMIAVITAMVFIKLGLKIGGR